MADAHMTPDNPLAEYWTEDEMAEVRGKTPRTLRAERQRGDGPPYAKDGRTILYSMAGYREWLLANTRQPVSSGRGR
jgi:hypothetical protein